MPDQVFEEVTFSLAGSSLYLYTDGLSEGLARSLEQPDEPENLKALIDRFCALPRQQRLQSFADEVSDNNARFDDLTILLIEQDRYTDSTMDDNQVDVSNSREVSRVNRKVARQ